jgi:hypothetical protein
VSNRRKLRGTSGRKLPRCADCHSITYAGTTRHGAAAIRVEHDPWCPAWRGITPSTVTAFARAEAGAGRTVIYCRDANPTQPKERSA